MSTLEVVIEFSGTTAPIKPPVTSRLFKNGCWGWPNKRPAYRLSQTFCPSLAFLVSLALLPEKAGQVSVTRYLFQFLCALNRHPLSGLAVAHLTQESVSVKSQT